MKNITIKDISEICGVSKQTVSRVLNNDKSVKEKTRNNILEVIKKYDYKPNLYARNLSTKNDKRRKNILVSVRTSLNSSANIWLNLLIKTIVSINKEENISIIIEEYCDKESGINNSLINTTNSFVDGVIIFYEEENDERLTILKKSKIPYIIYGQAYNKNDICVAINSEKSIKIAVEYLFSRNLKDIVFISALRSPVNISREDSVKKVYDDNGVDRKNLKIIKDILSLEDIYNKTKELYLNGYIKEAVFVSGDEKAIAVMNALVDLGVKIPEDISVMGFDNIPISKYLNPSLSTISFDYEKIAKTILNKILSMLDGNYEESVYFDGELVVRNSTK